MHRSEFFPEKPRDFRDLVGEAFLSGFSVAAGELIVGLQRNLAISFILIARVDHFRKIGEAQVIRGVSRFHSLYGLWRAIADKNTCLINIRLYQLEIYNLLRKI